jgi:hypothetical protein
MLLLQDIRRGEIRRLNGATIGKASGGDLLHRSEKAL